MQPWYISQKPFYIINKTKKIENCKLKNAVKPYVGRKFDPQVAFDQLYSEPLIVMSWGGDNFKGIANECLVFQVNGKLHKGVVVITLGFEDLYTIILLDKNFEQVGEATTGIYAEDLAWCVDGLVETIDR